MDEILHKNIVKYLDTSDTGDMVREKLLFTNVFISPISAFIQRRASKGVVVECSVTKM